MEVPFPVPRYKRTCGKSENERHTPKGVCRSVLWRDFDLYAKEKYRFFAGIRYFETVLILLLGIIRPGRLFLQPEKRQRAAHFLRLCG